MKKSAVLLMTMLFFLVVGLVSGVVYSQDDGVTLSPDVIVDSGIGLFQNEEGV